MRLFVNVHKVDTEIQMDGALQCCASISNNENK